MNCANHPEVPALATCTVCGTPLCPVCAHFYQGQPFCAAHSPAPGGEARPAAEGVSTRPLPPPVPPGTLVPGVPPVPGAYGPQRLQPLPMEHRPGWSQEPLERPPSGAETYGQVGAALGVSSLVLAFCCGIFGILAGVIAMVLGIAALVGARTARDPQKARTFGALSLVLGGIGLVGALVLFAVPLLALFSNGQFP